MVFEVKYPGLESGRQRPLLLSTVLKRVRHTTVVAQPSYKFDCSACSSDTNTKENHLSHFRWTVEMSLILHGRPLRKCLPFPWTMQNLCKVRFISLTLALEKGKTFLFIIIQTYLDISTSKTPRIRCSHQWSLSG